MRVGQVGKHEREKGVGSTFPSFGGAGRVLLPKTGLAGNCLLSIRPMYSRPKLQDIKFKKMALVIKKIIQEFDYVTA